MRYGAYSMELLVNGLLREGAQRQRLRAKLFGGARMLKGLTDVGDANAAFAERFLRQEGITVVGGSLRGDHGRRIQFWPTTGRAQQIEFGSDEGAVFKAGKPYRAGGAPTPLAVWNCFDGHRTGMSISEPENDSQKMRVADLMQAFEAELLDLGRLAERAQTTLSNVLAHAAHDPECHRDAQVLDLLTQRLYGHVRFSHHPEPVDPGGLGGGCRCRRQFASAWATSPTASAALR